MYGIIIENICERIKSNYGEEVWLKIRDRARICEYMFVTHRVYSEKIVPRLARVASEVIGCTEEEFMDMSGHSFVEFVSRYEYGPLLRCLGRNLGDFVNGLDNLHEYMRFSYPKLKPPSFFCTEETSSGLTLHYRTRRQGYMYYVVGQLKEVGLRFYDVDVDVKILNECTNNNTFHVIFRLTFDNKEFCEPLDNAFEKGIRASVRSSLLLDLFPFHIVFNSKMIINCTEKSKRPHLVPRSPKSPAESRSGISRESAGRTPASKQESSEINHLPQIHGNVLNSVLPNLVDEPLDHHFTLIRPIANLTWDAISTHTNNVFELCSKSLVGKPLPARHNEVENSHDGILPEDTSTNGSRADNSSFHGDVTFDCASSDDDCHENETRRYPIRLKGQMMMISEWNSFIFLCTPIMVAISDLDRLGLYINDLSMHDSSRDLLLAGSQQSAELKLALDQEQIKSAELENSMCKLDMEIRKTDSLLYQMIPRTVADKLRSGEPATSTCEIFHEVTILFSDVVGFTRICSKITPMAVVAMLNDMYTTFDHLSECNNVYKVETIGDAYMVVSGAPNPTRYHAQLVAEMALAMQSSMHKLQDPSDGGNMKIRIGIHTGTVVAGVVGMKMPRYCLFGDAVNTASRMESTGESCKIHVSEVTYRFLEGWPYVCEKRGVTHIKGKGSMITYWLKGRTTRQPPKEVAELCPSYCLLPVSEHRNRSNSSGASSDVMRPNSRYEQRRESDSSVHLGIMGYQHVKGISDVESGWTWRPPNAETDQNSSLPIPGTEHHSSEKSLPTSLSCPHIDTSMKCLSIQEGDQACLVNSVVDTKT